MFSEKAQPQVYFKTKPLVGIYPHPIAQPSAALPFPPRTQSLIPTVFSNTLPLPAVTGPKPTQWFPLNIPFPPPFLPPSHLPTIHAHPQFLPQFHLPPIHAHPQFLPPTHLPPPNYPQTPFLQPFHMPMPYRPQPPLLPPTHMPQPHYPQQPFLQPLHMQMPYRPQPPGQFFPPSARHMAVPAQPVCPLPTVAHTPMHGHSPTNSCHLPQTANVQPFRFEMVSNQPQSDYHDNRKSVFRPKRRSSRRRYGRSRERRNDARRSKPCEDAKCSKRREGQQKAVTAKKESRPEDPPLAVFDRRSEVCENAKCQKKSEEGQQKVVTVKKEISSDVLKTEPVFVRESEPPQDAKNAKPTTMNNDKARKSAGKQAAFRLLDPRFRSSAPIYAHLMDPRLRPSGPIDLTNGHEANDENSPPLMPPGLE